MFSIAIPDTGNRYNNIFERIENHRGATVTYIPQTGHQTEKAESGSTESRDRNRRAVRQDSSALLNSHDNNLDFSVSGLFLFIRYQLFIMSI